MNVSKGCKARSAPNCPFDKSGVSVTAIAGHQCFDNGVLSSSGRRIEAANWRSSSPSLASIRSNTLVETLLHNPRDRSESLAIEQLLVQRLDQSLALFNNQVGDNAPPILTLLCDPLPQLMFAFDSLIVGMARLHGFQHHSTVIVHGERTALALADCTEAIRLDPCSHVGYTNPVGSVKSRAIR
jgi:hypothetical protein